MALREPVNIVSKYIRSSPNRPRPPGSPIRRRQAPTVHLAKFHDNIRVTREEFEESDNEVEVFCPFPLINEKKDKGKTPEVDRKGTTGTLMNMGSVKLANKSEVSRELRPLRPLSLQNTMPSTSTSTTAAKKPLSRTSATKQPRNTASKLVKSTSNTSTTSVTSEPDVELPVYSYKDYANPKPYVVYTRDMDEANDLVAGLKPGPVALDMEWCFFRTWGAQRERRTAVVQVADGAGLVLVIHLHKMPRFPKVLQALIENPNIPKLGANILNDGKKLFRDYGILAKNLLELGVVAAAWDPAHNSNRKVISLAKLTAKYCGRMLLKGDERTSNWEIAELSQLQKDYAANDVHCSLEIFKKLHALSSDKGTNIPAGADVAWYVLKDVLEGEGMGAEMRLQWRRAHNLWHEKRMMLEKMCVEMRVRKEGEEEGPLKTSTVISYVVYALQADPKLPFDIERLRELVQMDAASWERHRTWLIAAWFRGIEQATETGAGALRMEQES